MIIIVFLVVAAWAMAISFVVGRATADRQVSVNHHKLAMFAVVLRGKDDMVPFLSTNERQQLDSLVANYTQLEARHD